VAREKEEGGTEGRERFMVMGEGRDELSGRRKSQRKRGEGGLSRLGICDIRAILKGKIDSNTTREGEKKGRTGGHLE